LRYFSEEGEVYGKNLFGDVQQIQLKTKGRENGDLGDTLYSSVPLNL
jgi:hypothetical protein